MKKRRVLFVITEDWYFVSHRLDLAIGLIQKGYEVAVAVNIGHHKDIIEGSGVKVYEFDIKRGSTNPLTLANSMRKLSKICEMFDPDIIHSVAIQPTLVGAVVGRWNKVPMIVSAIAGRGHIFSSSSIKSSIMKSLITTMFRFFLNKQNNHQMVQNEEDLDFLEEHGIGLKGCNHLLPGAGVNLDSFRFAKQQVDEPTVVFAARLLAEKGICEFVEAATELKKENLKARFVVVGETDDANPSSIRKSQLQAWRNENHVEFWGWKDNMVEVYAQTQIFCLPSYHEGFPKVLLEAAAAKCAIIASDISGCRQLIEHEENGLIVPVRDKEKLKQSIWKLATDAELRIKLAERVYDHVEKHNTIEIVIDKTDQIYSTPIR